MSSPKKPILLAADLDRAGRPRRPGLPSRPSTLVPSQGLDSRVAPRSRAEVELVIAEHRDVGVEQIVQLDHLRALGDAGQHRGRDQIAAERGDGVRGRRPLSLEQGGELGGAATTLLGAISYTSLVCSTVICTGSASAAPPSSRISAGRPRPGRTSLWN